MIKIYDTIKPTRESDHRNVFFLTNLSSQFDRFDGESIDSVKVAFELSAV